MHGAPRFRYLNRENRWAGFTLRGLTLDEDGALRLAHLPGLEGDAPAGLAALPRPTEPGGIAVGPDGAAYFADVVRHQVWRVDPCDGSRAPLACIGGPGDVPGTVYEPRGLAYHPSRRALVVVDSLNHRLQLFELATLQLVDVWGGWGDGDGQFRKPWSVAVDREGSVYVTEHTTARVQKFDAKGRVDVGFWEKVRSAIKEKELAWQRPVAVATSGGRRKGRVYVLDGAAGWVHVFFATGVHERSLKVETDQGSGVAHTSIEPIEPMGLAADAEGIYVGDNAGRRILRFLADGTFVGAALGYDGPVAALGIDGQGGLIVQPGAGMAPVTLTVRGGHARYGYAWGGPFRNDSYRAEQWHWITSELEAKPGAHVQLFVLCTRPEEPAPVGDPPWRGRVQDFDNALKAGLSHGPGLSATGQAVPSPWLGLPIDVTECLVPGAPGGELVWVGVAMTGDGLESAALKQVRLEFDHLTWLPHLPAVYQGDDASRRFLARFLTMFESLFSEAERSIDRLPQYFDAAAAPKSGLAWLGSWLGLEVHEDWSEPTKRRAIAEAIEMHGLRGTVEGLRRAVRLYTGADVRIQEPYLTTQWWSLAPPAGDAASSLESEGSVLGLTTMLAPAAPQGAIVGSTATLDGSHLISGDQVGEPLFTDVAHQFSVLLYRGAGYSDAVRDAVRAVIDREQPAHTTYQLCVIEPRMRIGWQARVGIDTVVAGPPGVSPLGDADAAAPEITLGGDPPGAIGDRSRLGVTTRLR